MSSDVVFNPELRVLEVYFSGLRQISALELHSQAN